MHIIRLSTVDSTNTYLKSLLKQIQSFSEICVVSEKQTKGRGQFGNQWKGNAKENLYCSVFLPVSVSIEPIFKVNLLVSIAVYQALKNFIDTFINKQEKYKLHIKWPNDVILNDKKIGGILIENIWRSGKLQGSIVGIGINVNQSVFEYSNASSLSMLFSSNTPDISIDNLLFLLLEQLKYYWYKSQDNESIYILYQDMLYRKDILSTFIHLQSNTLIKAYIRGVTSEGHLILQQVINNGLLITKTYELKQLKFCYDDL